MSYTAMPIEELDSLPRPAFVEAIAPLFEGAPSLVARLAGDRPFGSWWNLLARARVVAHALPEAEQIELLNSHPRLGAPPETVSRLSFEEQGYDERDTLGGDPPGRDTPSVEPSPVPPPPRPPVTHAPTLPSTGLRSRLEHRAQAGSEKPTWGSAASAGAAPVPPSAASAGPGSGAAPATPTATTGSSAGPDGDSTRAKLARLNDAYEDWFGFRYCVFVAGRPVEALVPELELAMAQSREHELQRGIDAVVDIAVARSGMAR